jgi:thiamine pyrophosphokinase
MVFFMSRAVIFVNGVIRDPEYIKNLLLPDDSLIAADGGARHVRALGKMPAAVIGDMDSLREEEITPMRDADVKMIQHSRDKSETDFELALGYAAEAGFSEVLIVGALGGRLDQTLGNLALLSQPNLAGMQVWMEDGQETVRFVQEQVDISGKPGDIVSLIPWGSEVSGVTTEGLRWPLHQETLHPDRTRGISNEMVGETASVSVKAGLLLLVQRHHFMQSNSGG